MTKSISAAEGLAPSHTASLAPYDLQAAITKAVDVPTLRRETGATGDGAVKVPRPRFALRVGVTGHRPARLDKAAQKFGMSLDEHENWLAEKLAQVFTAIEDGVRAAHDRHKYGPEGAERRFYGDREPPLLRLVSGLALGADSVVVHLVDKRFRGPRKPLTPDDLIHIREPRADSKQAPPIEWQLDAILPFPAADFAFDAIEDFVVRHREIPDDQLEATFHAHWRDVFSLPDTTLTMPTTWRRGEAANAPGEELARRIGLLRKAEMRDALAQVHGPVASPPDVPGEEEKDLRLDYGLAGEFMLRQIDLLVAVWDGEPARGVGGAPDLVANAIDNGLPVVYIDPDDLDAPPRMVYAVERLESRSAIVGWRPLVQRPKPELADACVEALREKIVEITAPPSGTTVHKHKQTRDNRERITDFLDEDWPSASAPRVYRAFQNLFGEPGLSNARKFFAACLGSDTAAPDDQTHHSENQWRAFINDDPDEGLQAVRLKQILHRRYVVADLLAVKYADLYRAAFVKAYLLAALAVIIAVGGFLVPHAEGHEKYWLMAGKGVLVLAEFLAIVAIWQIVREGERGHWHEKFVQYRGLAESLRHLRFLATFAEFAEAGGLRLSGESSWWLWYLRATARELGLPQGELGPTYQRSLLSIVKSHEIEDQIAYHEATASRESETDHAIHHAGNFLFALTAWMLGLTLIAFFLVFGFAVIEIIFRHFHLDQATQAHDIADALFRWLGFYKPAIGFFAAILPTLGAALAGIRFTADFDGKAARSFAMKHDLEAISVSIDRAITKQDFTATRAVLLQTASVMAEDVAAFQSLYGRKPLILPG